MIGKRLKLARSATGLSLRALEAKIGRRVTAQAIGKYERNESTPSSGVLMELAQALGVRVAFLVSDQELVLEDVQFRKNGLASRVLQSRIEANVVNRLERYLAVEEVLGLPSLEWDKPREAPYPVNDESGGPDAAAASLRMHWRLGRGPLPSIAELLEERGIKVLSLDMENVHGLYANVRVRGGGVTPVIVYNRNDCGDRQRFTMAHELAHAVLQPATGIDSERAAHRFSEALLMPAEMLWAELGKSRTVVTMGELFHLKARFGASVQAITHRCKHLEIFDGRLSQELSDLYRNNGWSVPPYQEPNPVPREESWRFNRLCYRALSEGALYDSRVAELLEISVDKLDNQLSEVPELAQVGSFIT